MLRTLVVFSSLSLPVFASAAAPALDVQEGQWEVTVKMEMPGMPMAMPPVTMSQCITKKDLVPHSQDKDQECKPPKTKIDGNTVTWSIECKGKDGSTMTGNGKVTYKGASFEGAMDMTMDHGGQPMKMAQKMTGKRVGDCKK